MIQLGPLFYCTCICLRLETSISSRLPSMKRRHWFSISKSWCSDMGSYAPDFRLTRVSCMASSWRSVFTSASSFCIMRIGSMISLTAGSTVTFIMRLENLRGKSFEYGSILFLFFGSKNVSFLARKFLNWHMFNQLIFNCLIF